MQTNLLRSTQDYSEILKILHEIQQSESEILIWQKNDINDHRIVDYCKMKRIDRKLGTIVLSPSKDIFSGTFNKRMSIYFKGKEHSVLFKEQIHFVSNQLLVLNIPHELRLLEKRSSPRTTFKFEDEKSVFISKFEENMIHPRNYELILLDISSGGIAFNLSPQQHGSIKKGDTIFIVRLFNNELPNPISAEVKYTAHVNFKIKGMTKKGIRVGAKFHEPDAYQSIRDLIN